MRTTLTIDDHTDRKLKEIAHRTGKSYKEVVNETLRAGLQATGVREKATPYKLKPAAMGQVAAGFDLDKALQLADGLEDEEIVHKLVRRK